MDTIIIDNINEGILQDPIGLIVYNITKNEVLNSDFSRIDSMFGTLLKSKGKVHSRIILGFEYDDDPRELYTSPEVCKFMNRIYKKHPYLFYYLFTAESQAAAFFK